MTPMPPASAMAIASLASVTVSIAAEMIGRLRPIVRVSWVPIFVALGMTALNPGPQQNVVERKAFGNRIRFNNRHRHALMWIEGADGARLASAA